MSMTSIKVPTELRDRVSRLARQQGVSQSAYLDGLLKQAEEQDFWRRMADVDAEGYRAAVDADGDQLNEDFGAEESAIRAAER